MGESEFEQIQWNGGGGGTPTSKQEIGISFSLFLISISRQFDARACVQTINQSLDFSHLAPSVCTPRGGGGEVGGDGDN